MNLFKLANALERHVSPLSIQKDVCTQIKSTLSSCTSCIDHCPSGSISIAAKEIELSNCTECGICGVVCPTSTFSWKRPSFKQMLEQAERQYRDERNVIIYCSHSSFPRRQAGMEVPCLAAVPWEVWMSMLLTYPPLSIYLPEGACQTCRVTTGERVLSEQLQRAEQLCQKQIIRVTAKELIERQYSYDISRRQFIQSAFRELRETGKEVIKEYLGEVQSANMPDRPTQDQADDLTEITKEIQQRKAALVEKLLNESRYSYVERRKLLLQQLGRNQELTQRLTIKLPVLNPACDHCGACTILCPTQAIRLQETGSGGGMEIRLQPAQCTACGLCEEICWENHIRLMEQGADMLLQSDIAITEVPNNFENDSKRFQ